MQNDNQPFDIEEEIYRDRVMDLINSICHIRNISFDQVHEEMKHGKSIINLIDETQNIVGEMIHNKNITKEQIKESEIFLSLVKEVLDLMQEKYIK